MNEISMAIVASFYFFYFESLKNTNTNDNRNQLPHESLAFMPDEASLACSQSLSYKFFFFLLRFFFNKKIKKQAKKKKKLSSGRKSNEIFLQENERKIIKYLRDYISE